MVDQLWAPWRLSYVTEQKPDGCVFCAKCAATDDEDSLILARGERCFVVMNLYPYNNGHLMVVPNEHLADPRELDDHTSVEVHELIDRSLDALQGAMAPEGFNVGLNLGSAAGAGIAQHLHWHIVPRWNGDTNFMPVLGETTVIPQHLQQTWRELRAQFDDDGGT